VQTQQNNMTESKVRRPVFRSILRGVLKRCPNCGDGRIFKTYLKPTVSCQECSEKLGHIRTDDFAPWLMILIVGHIVVSLTLFTELTYSPPLWVHAALWTPTIILLTLGLLPHAKGACLGLMWALGLHGEETQ
jgi:uncharacterized protein (DUF983 family)